MSPFAAAAWMMVRPSAIAVTSPLLSTVASSGRSDFQVTAPGSPAVPLSVTACGISRAVSPGRRRRDAGSNVRVTPSIRGAVPPPGVGVDGSPPVTGTATEPRRVCPRASTRARPGARPTTTPSGPTRAIVVSELRKLKRALEMRLPWRSKAAAKTVCFCPTPSVMVSGVT